MREYLIFAGVSVVLSCACSSESSNEAALGGAQPGSLAVAGTGGGAATPPGSGGGSSTVAASTTGGASSGSISPIGTGGPTDPETTASGGVSTGEEAGGTGGATTSTAGNLGGTESAAGGVSAGGSDASDTGGGASSDPAAGVGGRTSAGGTTGEGDSSGQSGGDPGSGGSAHAGGTSPGVGGRTSATGGGGTGSGGRLGADGGAGASSTGQENTGGMEGHAASGGNTNEAGSGGSPGQVGCDRDGLQAAVDTYLAALETGDTTPMPLAAAATYNENLQNSSFGQGLWQSALPVSFSRSFLDVQECQTFTELFVTEGTSPYVIGTRLVIEDGMISVIESIVTGEDDWNFDATAYQTCSESEDWSVVPAAEQSTREELIAAGEAYFAVFSDDSAEVPWGSPCYRLEGGAGCTPSMAAMSQSCNVGIPDGITFTGTHWVVDVDMNTAVGITKFGGALPDSHMFRLSNGKIRFIHTLTVM